MIRDFLGSEKIETFSFSDGDIAFDSLWTQLSKYTYDKNILSASSIVQAGVYITEHTEFGINLLEYEYADYDTPAWFNDIAYMRNKAAQAGLSSQDLKTAFEGAGFYGKDGDFIHFAQHGQWEDVSPVASFDPNYYYRSKVAHDNGITVPQVTIEQAQAMKNIINGAGMNAWTHYQMYGSREGIDASGGFDTSSYMEIKLQQMKQADPNYTMNQLCDVFAAAGLSAAAHYEAYGKSEGLHPVAVTGVATFMNIETAGVGVE